MGIKQFLNNPITIKIPIFNFVHKKGISIKDPILTQIFGGNSETKLTNPYSQISVVYAAIRAKAINVSQVPFKIYPLTGEDEIKSGAIIDLFNNVNPYSSKTQLWEAIVTLLDNTGEGAVIMDSEVTNGGIPVALWPTHRNNMQEAFQGGSFTGWNVKVKNQTIFVNKDQVIFTKYYNPNDLIRGLSPIGALQLTLDSDWGATKYNQTFFNKGQSVGSVFSTPDHLNDDSYKRLKRELIQSRQGSGHMHEALLLDGGLTLSNTRPSNRDMEFLELKKFTREDVAMVFKVPKSELSLYEDINLATAQSADIGFWKKTLIPLMRLIESQFNTSMLNPLGFRGEFDVKVIDVLNEDITVKADGALKYWQMGIPFNVINQVMDLGFPEIETGNTPSFELRTPTVPKLEPTKNIDPDIIKALEITGSMPKPIATQEEILKGMRDAKWKSLMKPVLPLMAKMSKNVKNYYHDVEQKLYKQVNKHFTNVETKAVGKDIDLSWVDESFNEDKLKKAIEPIIEESVMLGIGTNMIPDENILAMIASRGSKIISINDNAIESVKRGLVKILDEAIKEGWTEDERASAINGIIKDQMKNNKTNARTIARTETHSAFEEGRYEGIKSTNPTSKMWLSSRDGEVRPEHQIDGETVKFEDEFSNGLIHPLDPDGEAGNVINCRCTWIPVYDDE